MISIMQLKEDMKSVQATFKKEQKKLSLRREDFQSLSRGRAAILATVREKLASVGERFEKLHDQKITDIDQRDKKINSLYEERQKLLSKVTTQLQELKGSYENLKISRDSLVKELASLNQAIDAYSVASKEDLRKIEEDASAVNQKTQMLVRENRSETIG